VRKDGVRLVKKNNLAHSDKVEEWSEEEDWRPWPGNRLKSHRKKMKIKARGSVRRKVFYEVRK
jgi:hypothetical protein